MVDKEFKDTPVPMPRGSPLTYRNHDYDNFTPLIKKPVPLPRHAIPVLGDPISQENLDIHDNVGTSDKLKNDTFEETISKGYSTLTKSIKRTTGNVHEKSKAVIESTKNVSAKIEKSVRNILYKRPTVMNVKPDSIDKECNLDFPIKRNRCQSLPSEGIFKSISFGSPIPRGRINDDETNSPPPPEYPPPPLPDESIYDEISNKSSHSGSQGDYYTCGSIAGSNPETESVYEELTALKQLSIFEGSDSDSSFNFDSKSFTDPKVNVSRSGSWSFYDTVQILPRPKSEPYENVTIRSREDKNNNDGNIYVTLPEADLSKTENCTDKSIIKEHNAQNFTENRNNLLPRQISEESQPERYMSSMSVANELYSNLNKNIHINADVFNHKKHKKSTPTSKSVIFEFDPLYENVMLSQTSQNSRRDTESLPPYTAFESDDSENDFDTASLPVPPKRFDSIPSEIDEKDFPNDVEYYLYHRPTKPTKVKDKTSPEKCSIENLSASAENTDSSQSESPERELGAGKKKTNLVRWTSMKRAIKMVADGSHWSPGVIRRISKRESPETEINEDNKSENAETVMGRPEISSVLGPLHSGFLFKPCNNDKNFVQKWCQLAEGKLSYAAEKNGTTKDVVLLQKVYSIQIIHDIKENSESEDIYCMEISTSCKEKPHLVGSPGTTERRIWMQKLLESMTRVFPARLTADYTRAGWCYLKVGISGSWLAAWILLQKRTLYYCPHNGKLSNIDLRKARCIVLQENNTDHIGVSVVDSGPLMLVDTPDQALYLQMDLTRETKAWKHIIKAAAVENGPTLDDQQLTKDGVPTIVDKCINFIYAHGSMSEGIYRRSGGNTNITSLLTMFQKDAWAVQLSRQEYSEFEVASVLKRFFRNLPEPLLTTQLHVQLCSASGLTCELDDKISRYRTLLEKLPLVNYVTLRRLMGHLYFIHQQREHNLMPVENLAAIWGPTLMHVMCGTDANWSKRESEVVCDLISMYPKLFLVDGEELAREQRMQEVLERYHNSRQTPLTQKPSGDIKVWVHITSKESGNCVGVTVGPQRDAGDVCQELCTKMSVYGHELCLMESVLGGALIRPLHHSEKVFDTVLRWGYWDDADCKDNCLILVFNTIYRDIAAIAKPPVAQCGELRFADTKSKSFKTFLFEFSQAKLSYYKDKSGAVKIGEWKIEDVVWYIGFESRRNPHTRWAITFINKNNKPKRIKTQRIWVHVINTLREEEGEFYTLVPQLLKDEKRFFVYFRMPIKSFDKILTAIRNDITKQFTNWRRPIPPEERLTIALRYLATGDSFSTIGHSFRIGFSTVSEIVLQVCVAIWNNMKSRYLPQPTTCLWKNCANRFLERWGFPNCVGSIDGKHILIKCPDNAGSCYYNYLKRHSIVLLAVVGPEYEFLCIDVGAYGRNSDGGIFEESEIGKLLEQQQFGLPPDELLPGQTEPSPYVLIGDEAFGLKPYLLRPFPYAQSKNDPLKEKYNTGLCRARRVVENAFGILTMKWRLFLRPIELKVSKIKHIVAAACLLHNFLRLENCDEQYTDVLNQPEPQQGEMTSIQTTNVHRSSNISYVIRERFVQYFSEKLITEEPIS